MEIDIMVADSQPCDGRALRCDRIWNNLSATLR